MSERDPSTPVFSTERLDVFHVHCTRAEHLGCGRDVYLAFHRVEDIPRPICTVTLWGNWVEWIETVEDWRRAGIATEMIHGLERHVGVLEMDSATEAGEAFLQSLEAKGN